MFSGLVFAAQSFGLRVRACLGFRKFCQETMIMHTPAAP